MSVATLGVIPARGGSKRIPRKNLRSLCGKPLIQWTIEACQKSGLTNWVVSTDNYEIERVALNLGAYVIRRPEELAQDDTTTGAVLEHALRWMETADRYEMVVCLHPTSPVRNPAHIDEAIEKLRASPLPVLASVCRLPNKTHPNIGTILDEGEWNGSSWVHYITNASIYCVKSEWLLKHKKHMTTPCVPFEMDRRHSVDIDEEIDFKLAELFLLEQ